jgi:hypothetical protein
VVLNQHQADRWRADATAVNEAAQHLRRQIQLAVSSGWSVQNVDGRHRIVAGSEAFTEVVAETVGMRAESVQDYLLTVQPAHMLSLLALLEALNRDIATASVSPSVRHAVLELAERLLGRWPRPRT